MASAKVSISAAKAAIARDFQTFRAKFPAAEARALNRSIGTGRTTMTRLIVEDTGLAAGVVRNEIVIELATTSKKVARLIVKGSRIPLINFKARGPEPSRGKGRGVTARLPQATTYPHAFIATLSSGHRGVFQRVNLNRSERKSRGARGKNLPIRELRGPSLPRVFEKHTDEGMAVALAALNKNLTHELAFAANRAAQTPF